MKNLSIIILSLLLSSNLFAHGEDKYGPHGGFIKMPAAFHTELIPSGNGNFIVYLLDLQNKNAATINSNVTLKYKNKKAEFPFECIVVNDYFRCTNTSRVELTDGNSLVLKADRLNVVANPIAYDLPLALKAKAGAKPNAHH